MTEIIEGELISTDLVYQPPQNDVSIWGTTDPGEIIQEATRVAEPLAQVVRKQELAKRIGQSEHVKVEGWTLLGSMLGVFAVPDGDPEIVEIEGAFGFKAKMKAVTRNGDVVGGGTSYCLRSEERWRNADVYAMSSMAQTRATSRALKGPLGFVMKLAGFESTPAEEMTPEMKAPPKKDKAPAMRTRIKELSVEADGVRGDTKTAGEVEAAIKGTWDTTLAKLDEAKLAVLGSDLSEWLKGGCVGEFKMVPF